MTKGDQQILASKGGVQNGGDNNNQENGKNGKEQGTPTEYINFGEEDQMEIEGYQKSMVMTLITWVFILLTLGLLRLVFHWWPRLLLFATHSKCSIESADKILVTEDYQQKYQRYYVKPVYRISADILRNRGVFSHSGGFTIPASGDDNLGGKLDQEFGSIVPPKISISNGKDFRTPKVRAFNCKKLRYIWNDEDAAFLKLRGFDDCATSDLHQNEGLSVYQQCQRRLIYGDNEIKVEVQSMLKLLFLEVLNPFYVFQIFSVALWMSDHYVYYATAIIIMSAFGIISTVIQTRSNQRKLQEAVQSSDIVNVCRGSGVYESISAEQLVPGDLILIPPHGGTMSCDAALLSGNCIVNESMLTGESVPVTKTPLTSRSDVFYNSKEHARNTLFCGTHIMQTRYYGNEQVTAVVLRTGFLTAKGNLVRSILYPPPVDYKFERDSYKFVAVLASIAMVGFVNSVLMKVANGESLRTIVVKSLDLITIVVPPALPAAMTVGRMYAQRRLQEKGIYCISPRAINVSGSIDCVCFDKTGTLTEEGLDLWGVIPTQGLPQEEINSTEDGARSEIAFEAPIREAQELSLLPGTFTIGMAACHSLTRIDGNLIGDPLDLKMFEWTGWLLEEPSVAENEKYDMVAPTIVRPQANHIKGNEAHIKSDAIATPNQSPEFAIGIVRQFPFSSSLQRMSVITRELGGSEFELYCKGSPEMISSLASPHSVPKNFSATLERYTEQGYRVIALGHRHLGKMNYAKVQRAVREEVETDLTFLGFIIMENRLKKETTGVMQTLKNAAIRTIMVTGDNILTAISVARECGMLESSDKIIVLNSEEASTGLGIPKLTFNLAKKNPVPQAGAYSKSIAAEVNGALSSGVGKASLANVESPLNRYHFALTGTIFGIIRTHYPEIMPNILVRGTVFARMSPDQKQQLVQELQGLDYFVGMCGDGANDCGALKAAHAGISLSEAESSVASPFTSKDPNITCVPYLIKEGRSALVTSFGIFKYMAVYSLTQFITVITLYTISANLGDLQFLYIDLFLISVFALFFGRTEPYAGPLERRPPSASLVSLAPIASILLHMLSVLGFQVLAFLYVQEQSWFKPFKPNPEDEERYNGGENYALFTVSAFQYIIMAVVFSRGKPYRKSLVTNPGLLASLVLMTALTIFLVLFPFGWSEHHLQIQIPEDRYFGLILIGFALCNFFVALFIEHVLVNFILGTKLEKLSCYKRNYRKSGEKYAQIDFDLSQRTDWLPSSAFPGTEAFAIGNRNPDKSPNSGFPTKANKIGAPNLAFVPDAEESMEIMPNHNPSLQNLNANSVRSLNFDEGDGILLVPLPPNSAKASSVPESANGTPGIPPA